MKRLGHEKDERTVDIRNQRINDIRNPFRLKK